MTDNSPHIEITGGRCRQPVTVDDIRLVRDVETFKHWRFFVDVIDKDGGRLSMWDGPSYEVAILTAEELEKDGFGPVHDLVVGGAV